MTEPGQIQSKPQHGWLRVVVLGRNSRLTFIRIGILVVTCFILFGFVLLPVRITGISMLPTLKNGSVNCVNRLAYVLHQPQRGDIVSIPVLVRRLVRIPDDLAHIVRLPVTALLKALQLRSPDS